MLKIENLTKSFGNHVVLNQLHLTVEKGSIFGLVGVNGAGKSTLLRTIGGIYQADSGTVYLDDLSVYENENAKRKIAFVADEPYFPIGTTLQSLHDFYKAMYVFDEEKYERYRRMFELEKSMNVANLSKGYKRRTALLFAIALSPTLLLLDEAYDGLEPVVRLRFRKMLMELVHDEKLTVIISSHNLKELEDVCDTFGILENGRIIQAGDLEQSKAQIQRYQVIFEKDLPEEFLQQFDVLHLEKKGRVYQMVIRGNPAKVEESLAKMNPVLLDVLPVNFEELFIYELESRESV